MNDVETKPRVGINPPIALLAELTHRCPLSCPYCSNPVELTGMANELSTEQWIEAFKQAAEIGVLQVHLSGGEPVSRRDLPELVRACREADLYVNLITSGIGLTEKRLHQLIEAGVDHIQLSLQGVRPEMADWIGGYKGGFKRKIDVAEKIAETGIPLTVNAVMHRHNLDELPQTLDLAIHLGARRLEIACVQFQGWALKNRNALQPTREQVDKAKEIVANAYKTLGSQLMIDFVPPDYYADYPKACMGGWASTGLNIAPDGKVLPCHAAETIPDLKFQNVKDAHLREIWYGDVAFNRFRGTDWMPPLCQSCDRRDIDHGGCRCQAMAITGNPAETDPVCRRSPLREMVEQTIAQAQGETSEFEYRKI